MKNYIFLGISLLALILCSIGAAIVDSSFLQILNLIMVPIDIAAICFHINNIISDAISKYDDEHYTRYHLKNSDEE